MSDDRIVAGSTARCPQAPSIDSPAVSCGLVNAHVRRCDARPALGPELYSRQNVLDQLRLYAGYGVTTVVSLGDDREEGFRVRDEQETPSLERARLYVAGAVVDATTPEAARAQVAALAALKPDWVKIRVDDTLGTTAKMPPAVYRAVIDEATSAACGGGAPLLPRGRAGSSPRVSTSSPACATRQSTRRSWPRLRSAARASARR
jgi:hypothetical protein